MPVDSITIGNVANGALRVTGAKAGLNVKSDMFLGKRGGSGTLIVTNGASVVAKDIYTGGYFDGSERKGLGEGFIQVSSDQSYLSANKIFLGVNDDYSHKLAISDGARVTADSLTINAKGYLDPKTRTYTSALSVTNAELYVGLLDILSQPSDDATFAIVSINDGGVFRAQTINAPFKNNTSPFSGDPLSGLNGTFRIADGGTLQMKYSRQDNAPSTTVNGMLMLDANSILSFNADLLDTQPDLRVTHNIATMFGLDDTYQIKIVSATNGTTPELGSDFLLITVGEGLLDINDAEVSLDYLFLDGELSVIDNSMYISFSRNDKSLSSEAVTSNELAVGSVLDTAGPDHDVHDALLGLTVDQSARAAFNGLTGEIHATLADDILNSVRRAAEIQKDRVLTALMPPTGTDRDPVAWMSTYGNKRYFDDHQNAGDSDSESITLSAGIDAGVDTQTRLGAAFGLTRTFTDIESRHSKAEIDTYHAAIYAGRSFERLKLSGGTGVSYHSIETKRVTGMAALPETIGAKYSAYSIDGWFDAAYPFYLSGGTVSPHFTLTAVQSQTEGFEEIGSQAALEAGRESHTGIYSTIGLRAQRSINLDRDRKLSLFGGIGMSHVIEKAGSEQNVSYVIGSELFGIGGRKLERNTFDLDVGLVSDPSSSARIALKYGGRFGERSEDHRFTAALAFPF